MAEGDSLKRMSPTVWQIMEGSYDSNDSSRDKEDCVDYSDPQYLNRGSTKLKNEG